MNIYYIIGRVKEEIQPEGLEEKLDSQELHTQIEQEQIQVLDINTYEKEIEAIPKTETRLDNSSMAEKVEETPIEGLEKKLDVKEIQTETSQEPTIKPIQVTEDKPYQEKITIPRQSDKPIYEKKKSPHNSYVPQRTSPSIPRTRVIPAVSYTKVKELEQEKDQTQKRRIRSEINSQIRSEKSPIVYPSKTYRKRRIHDLSDNLIGTFYTANSPDEKDHINLGDSEYVSAYSFRIDVKRNKEYCLRTTAYLTKEGTEKLRSYVKKQLKRRESEEKERAGGKGKPWYNNSKIKRIASKRNTFDIVIENINIHLDQKGKIEIIYEYPGLGNVLQNGQQLSGLQDARLRYFSKYSQVKKWIYNTTNDFNNFTGERLEELSVAVNEILVEETPCRI